MDKNGQNTAMGIGLWEWDKNNNHLVNKADVPSNEAGKLFYCAGNNMRI